MKQIYLLLISLLAIYFQSFGKDEYSNDSIALGKGQLRWTSEMEISHDLVIPAGTTLTITSNVYFSEDVRIVILPGGKLILDGGLLTSFCNESWEGVEVRGNSNAAQTPLNQGYIQIINGGEIENAELAVLLGSSVTEGSGGGMIHANDATFSNNHLSVRFDPYDYSPSNASYFYNSVFVYDRNLAPLETFTFVELYGVDYVNFEGCTFDNASNLGRKGTGIWASNSIVRVDKYCTGYQNQECTGWIYSTFDKLEYGVYATASTTNDFADIREVEFTGNYRAVYLSGMTLPRVTSCDFYFSNMQTDEGYGIYLDACTDYWIEDNYFQDHPLISTGTSIGIVVNESGTAPNEIYNNTFNAVNYGILAQGINRNTRTGEGLVCKCNTFTDGDYDIVVTDAAQGESTDFGIARYQGSSAAQADAPAGNRFSWTGPAGTDTDIDNLGLHFNYYYHVANPIYRLEPKYYDALKVNAEPNYNAPWDSLVSCPSYTDTTGGGGSTEEEIRGMLAESQQASDSLSGLIQSLEDAGDTEALEWDVDMSIPEQSYEVYSQLMNTAPYISDTVMEAAIRKEDVLPGAMIRDVMLASPESAKNDALLEKLNERANPPPAYMLAQILQGRSLVSVYGDLLAKQSYHNNRKAFAAKALERLYAADAGNPAAQDSLIHLLQAAENIRSQVQLAFLHLQQRDSASAVNTLAAIPGKFALDAQQLQEHAWLTAYFNQLLTMQGNLPDSTQAEWLMNATTEDNGIAGTFARNLLLGLRWIDYSEPIILPLSTKSSPMDAYRNLDPTLPVPDQLEVYPNPASDHIIVKWTLDTPPAGLTLKVTTIDGKLIRDISLSGAMGETVIGTNHLLPGIYLLSIHDGTNIIESKKVSIN